MPEKPAACFGEILSVEMEQSPGESVLEGEALSALIGRIYDTALDVEQWPNVLAEVSLYVGGPAAMIFWQDAATRTGARVFSYGDDPQFTESYFNHYVKLSPVVSIQHMFPIGEVHVLSDLSPPQELMRTRFYLEWMRPQSYVDNVFSVLDRTSTSYATVAVARSEAYGLADIRSRERMRQLVPHIRRSVLIGKIVDLQRTHLNTFTAIMDEIPAAIFLLARHGDLVHVNRSGQALIDAGQVLTCAGKRLIPRGPDTRHLFEEFCATAAAGDTRVDSAGVSVTLDGRDGNDYVAHLLPLHHSSTRDALGGNTAVAAVFVRRAGLDLKSPMEMVARKFNLTMRETQVLYYVLEGYSVRNIASALGISAATVKTHLQHIFNKTFVRRRSDLTKIVSSFAGLGC